MKEKQIEILRRQAEGIAFFPRTEECNRAFKEWVETFPGNPFWNVCSLLI